MNTAHIFAVIVSFPALFSKNRNAHMKQISGSDFQNTGTRGRSSTYILFV